jgi:ABC-type uncharacterized transport system permease subunit
MDWAPLARIVARYILGALAAKVGGDVWTDPELQNIVALILTGAAASMVEWLYAKAKARGWTL